VGLKSGVGIEVGNGLDRQGSILCRNKRFFSTPQRLDQWEAVSPWGTRLQREADCSPPSGVEVSDGAVPTLPPLSLWRSA
jgi:hypothetical protein